MHFNPRQREKGGQLVVNDKQDTIWGQAVTLPLSALPLIFGQTAVTLIVQFNADGFDFFVERKHCARLEHRTQLPSGNCSLNLQFPTTDDYGSESTICFACFIGVLAYVHTKIVTSAFFSDFFSGPENWKVYRVWWGHKESMVGDLTGVAGVNSYNAVHPRKLFIQRLPKLSTESEAEVRRAELERAFRKYGGKEGAIVTVPLHTTFAFVEVETERQAELALAEMSSTYHINRARRTRFEALQEQREAASSKDQNSEWE